MRGEGYVFSAPVGWEVKRAPTSVVVTSPDEKDTTLAAYSFGTLRAYRPSLWQGAVEELDHKARALAVKLRARLVSSTTTTVANNRARQYLFQYDAKRARLTFFYRGRREYELYCGWKAAHGEPAACGQLLQSFRLS